MPRIVSVVFGDGGKAYHFDPGSLELAVGDRAEALRDGQGIPGEALVA